MEKTPKILITTRMKACKHALQFANCLTGVIPNLHFYSRKNYDITTIIKFCKNREFTDIIVLNENRKVVNGMLLIHLPEGPTAYFKLSNVVLSEQIKGHGTPTSHFPEVILNNFNTRLGHTIGRMLGSMFPQKPQFLGRRVVTFHNQRDFIFF